MLRFVLLLLLASSPLLHASKCMDDCTQFQIDVPPKPESGTGQPRRLVPSSSATNT